MRLQVLIAICLTTLHFTGFQYLRDHLRHQGLEHLKYNEKDLHRGVISPIVYSFIYSCLPAWFFTSLQLYARLTECNKFKDANEPWTRKPLQMSDLEYFMTVLILKCYETCNNSCSLKLSLFFYAAKFSLNAAVMLTAQWIVHTVLDGQREGTSLPSEFKIQQHHNYNIYSL